MSAQLTAKGHHSKGASNEALHNMNGMHSVPDRAQQVPGQQVLQLLIQPRIVAVPISPSSNCSALTGTQNNGHQHMR